jgi:hypothetical protein
MALPKTKKSSGAPIKPRIRFLQVDPESHKPTGTEKDATELRFGLWDNFVEPMTPLPGKPISLRALNEEEAETRNLVGGDSRRFYIALDDPGAAGKGFVEVDWWTAYTDSDARVPGTVHDDPGSKMVLLETGKSTGVFVSKGLMLVNDRVDRGIKVHSGYSVTDPLVGKAHGGVRTDTQSCYRLRRAGMFGFSVASYQSKAMKTPVTVVAPVFLPSSRKLMPVQVYVVRKKKGGDVSVPTADIASVDLRVLTETYERMGIWVWTFASATDKAVAGSKEVKAGSPIEYTMLEIDPPASVGNAVVTLDDIDVLAKAFRGAGPTTLRLFFVEHIRYLIDGAEVLGISFGPNYEPQPSDDQKASPRVLPPETMGTGFARLARDPYTAAHELGHLLMPKSKNDGHYSTSSSFSVPGARHIAVVNLMRAGSVGMIEDATQTKRIWEGPDGNGDMQMLSLQISPFLR